MVSLYIRERLHHGKRKFVSILEVLNDDLKSSCGWRRCRNSCPLDYFIGFYRSLFKRVWERRTTAVKHPGKEDDIRPYGVDLQSALRNKERFYSHCVYGYTVVYCTWNYCCNWQGS